MVVEGGIVDLVKRLDAPDLDTLLARGTLQEARRFEGEAPDFSLDDVDFLPPVTRPGKILCVGINYRNRPGDFGRQEAPKYPSLFVRMRTSQVGHNRPILRPPESDLLDYEGEIALIVGKGGRRIDPARALEHIAGYACFNEGTLRDWTRHGVFNVTAGKNFAASGSFGPWMATADEISDPEDIHIRTRVNGEVRQDDTTANLIFPFRDLLAYISTFTPLAPGDVIATGTPVGTGAKMDPPRYLVPGDGLEIEVEGIGILSNKIEDEFLV